MIPRLSAPDLRSLDVFRAVAETGSMTAAAAQLQLSQPAVTQAVLRLEAALGSRLLDRSRRPLRVTPEGEVVLGTAQELTRSVVRLAERVRAVRSLPLRLRLGVVDSLTFSFLPALYAELREQLEFLSVASGLAHTLRASLAGGKLDFVISNDAMEDMDGLTRHLIVREPYILALPQALAEGEPLGLDRLGAALPLIRWGQHSLLARDVERQLRRLGLNLPRQFEFDSADAILGMVAAGIGWAVMTPLSVWQAAHVASKVALVPFPGPGFSRVISLVAPRNQGAALPVQIANASRRVMLRLVAEKRPRFLDAGRIQVAEEEPAVVA